MFGKGHDAELLAPIVDQVREDFRELGGNDIYRKAKISADSGFHTEDSMRELAERKVDGYVADKGFRRRDPAFQTAKRHRIRKALIGRAVPPDRDYFTAKEFVLNSANGKLVCPAGKELYVKDRNFFTANGYYGTQYMAKKTDCRVCVLRGRCLTHLGRPTDFPVFKPAKTPPTMNECGPPRRKLPAGSAGRLMRG